MQRRISVTEFRAIKRIAQAVNPLVVKKNKLKGQIEELVREYKSYEQQIEGMEGGVRNLTDGAYNSEDLIQKIIEPNGKFDKDGKALKDTKYLPTDKLVYDDITKAWFINMPEPEPVTENEPEMADTNCGAANY